MKRLALSTLAAVALVAGFGGTASAYDWFNVGQNDVYSSTTKLPLVNIGGCDCNGGYNGCSGNGGCDCDDCCGGCGPAWFAEAELLVLRYYRADGMRIGDDAPGDNVPGNYRAAPRVSLGIISAGGLGGRVRFFNYDESFNAVEGAPSRLNVDTFTIDSEAFERFAISPNWDMEASMGVRYTEFAERMFDLVGDTETRQVTFRGWGLITGLELRRQVASGAIYGRVRQSILADDQLRQNTGSGLQNIPDVILGITEINIGYEVNSVLDGGQYVYARIGAEYQIWQNFSSNFTTGTADPEQFWTGSSSVGFAGVSLSAGVAY